MEKKDVMYFGIGLDILTSKTIVLLKKYPELWIENNAHWGWSLFNYPEEYGIKSFQYIKNIREIINNKFNNIYDYLEHGYKTWRGGYGLFLAVPKKIEELPFNILIKKEVIYDENGVATKYWYEEILNNGNKEKKRILLSYYIFLCRA